jgi:VTC domain.
MLSQIEDKLQLFDTITLAEMEKVKLMNRVDTKFLVTTEQLVEILDRIHGRYFVQFNEGRRIADYNTLYYDTADLKMYIAHHNRKLNRQKLRARIYVDSGIAFCEIKNKNNKGRTKKKRIPMNPADFNDMLSHDENRSFVSEFLHYDVNSLSPVLENKFTRITLVNVEKTERLTIDMNVNLINRVTGRSACIPNLVIVELKQDGLCPSYFRDVLLDLRIQQKRISKYCLGTFLTNPDAKMNRFRRKMRYIEKLCNTKLI